MILLILVPLIYCMLWFISYLTLKHNYKYYKPTYLAIKNKHYLLYSNDEDFITFRPKEKMDLPNWLNLSCEEILYFKGSESIKLKSYQNGHHYIHKDFVPFFDPYTVYWYWKIKKQMLLHTRSIAEIRQDKLKQLNIK